jgi:hypothetical protein
MNAVVRISDLCAAMARANVETLRVEVEDGRVSLFASREDHKRGGWHGRAEVSVSGVAADRTEDLADLLLCETNASGQMDVARHLLPEPGPEVVGELIAELRKAQDHLEIAWGVIANAGVSLGDWSSMTPEWREAAEKWRDRWHEMLSANAAGQGAAKPYPAPACSASDPRIYACDHCGRLRNVAEGGNIFTLCDECWDKHFKTPNNMLSVSGERKETNANI